MQYILELETDDPKIIQFLAGRDAAAKVVQALKWWTTLEDTLRSINSLVFRLEERLQQVKKMAAEPPEAPSQSPRGDSLNFDERVDKLMERLQNFGTRKSPQGAKGRERDDGKKEI